MEKWVSWTGLTFVEHDATIDAYVAAMKNQNLLEVHEDISWGWYRGLLYVSK